MVRNGRVKSPLAFFVYGLYLHWGRPLSTMTEPRKRRRATVLLDELDVLALLFLAGVALAILLK
jgi:hypothetical protein